MQEKSAKINTVFDKRIRASWRRMLHLLKPMAVWTFLVWGTGVLILAPVTTFLMSRTVFSGDVKVIGNLQIIEWIISTPGILYLGFTTFITACVMIFRFTGLFLIVKQDIEGANPGIPRILLSILPQLKRLFKFSLYLTALILLALSILAAGFGLIYTLLLSGYDIHFLLDRKPVEWFIAIIMAIGWAVICGTIFGALALRSSLALPAYADGHGNFIDSVKCSWQISKKKIKILIRHMLFVSILYVIARFIPELLLVQFFTNLTGSISNWFTSLYPLLTTIGLYLLLSQAISAVTGFTSFSFISTMLTKFYFEHTDLHKEAASPPELSVISKKIRETLSKWLSPVRSVFVFFFLLIVSYSISLGFVGNMPELSGIKVIAHRAGPDAAPENTMEALEAAIRRGVQMAEIDIQQTADDVFVVVHDAGLMRVAGKPLTVAKSTYDELKHIVQGTDTGTEPDLRKIATLDEFLERSKGRIHLLIEIKNFGLSDRFESQLMDLIVKHDMEGQVELMSQNLQITERIKKVATNIPVGYTSAVRIGDLSRLSADFFAIRHQALTPQLVSSLQQSGRIVYAWTVNPADKIAAAIEMGVDGIITDYPDKAQKVLNEMEGMSVAERLLLQFHHLLLENEE